MNIITGPDEPGPFRKASITLLALSAIFLAALVIRIKFFYGIEYSDDLNYAFDAWELLKGTFTVSDGWRVRIGLLAPIALSYHMFGINMWSLMFYPLLCSLGLVVLSYLLGALFFNQSTGLLASLFMALFPLHVEYATKAMPDIPIAFWMALGVFVFFKTLTMVKNQSWSTGRAFWGFFSSGIVFAIAYLIRDTGALMILYAGLCLCMDLLLQRPHRNLWKAVAGRSVAAFAVILGFLLVFSIEGLYYLRESGDFFQRYHIVSGFFSGDEGFIKDLGAFPRGMFHMNEEWAFAWNDDYYPFGFFYYAFVPSLIFALFARFRKTWPLAFWWIFLFSYHQFGSMSLTHYILIHRLIRHLSVITVPTLLLLAYALTEMTSLRRSSRSPALIAKTAAVLTTLILVFSSLWTVGLSHRASRAITYDAAACYEVVRNYPDLNVYTDLSPVMHMRFLDGYTHPERFRFYDQLKYAKNEKKKIIILDSHSSCVLDHAKYVNVIPPGYRSPGPRWTLLKEITGPEYKEYAKFNPRVYLVEEPEPGGN